MNNGEANVGQVSTYDTLKAQQSIVWSLVCAADEFSIDTEAMCIQHRPADNAGRTYANVIGAYAYAIDAKGKVSAMVYVNRKTLDIASMQAPRTWANYPVHCAKNHVLARLDSMLLEKQKVA